MEMEDAVLKVVRVVIKENKNVIAIKGLVRWNVLP